MFYVTGDRHFHISDLVGFSDEGRITEEDTLIILGDAGFNYYRLKNGRTKKYEPIEDTIASVATTYEQLKNIKFEILVVQGNHEAPAWLCSGMVEDQAYGGPVVFNPEIPNVKYLRNGEIYTFNDKDYLVMGGAYSIDKDYRKPATKSCKGLSLWFPEEQMTDEEFEKVESVMNARHNTIHGILTHTCPKSIVNSKFLKIKDVDYRMEEKFDQYRLKFKFNRWYFGHYHSNFDLDKYTCLYLDIRTLL